MISLKIKKINLKIIIIRIIIIKLINNNDNNNEILALVYTHVRTCICTFIDLHISEYVYI